MYFDTHPIVFWLSLVSFFSFFLFASASHEGDIVSKILPSFMTSLCLLQDNLLDKLDEVEPEKASNTDEEVRIFRKQKNFKTHKLTYLPFLQCVVCESNKATMQTFPCAHQVVCRTCFVRTIQTTVAQKKLPLRYVTLLRTHFWYQPEILVR